MATEYSSPEQEAVQRMRRLETRIVKLCAFLGFDVTKDKDRVMVLSIQPLVLDVTGLDVSLGDLLDACSKSGITGTAALMCKGKRLGTIRLGEQTHGAAMADRATDFSRPPEAPDVTP